MPGPPCAFPPSQAHDTVPVENMGLDVGLAWYKFPALSQLAFFIGSLFPNL